MSNQMNKAYIEVRSAAGGDEANDLSEIIADKKPGEEVEIVIWRDGEEIALTAKLSDFSE